MTQMKRKDRRQLMTLAERHVVKQNHSDYQECARLCRLSKNLYNATLYVQRQSFFEKQFLNYYGINKLFTQENQVDYRALPAKVAKQTQMLAQQAFTSFFALMKKAQNQGYDKKVRLPSYLNKDGFQVVFYEKGALSFKEQGFVKLSQTSIRIKTSLLREQITNVRITPKGNHFVLEVLYDVMKPFVDENDYSRVAFVDPGLNNLMTVTSNVFRPLLYNGRPAKAVNQLYHKKRAQLQNKLPFVSRAKTQDVLSQIEGLTSKRQVRQSKALLSLTQKRNFRIHDLFHKMTTHLVNHLVANDVKVLIFGHNVGQKQDIQLGSRTNQNFVSLPFIMLMGQLRYKCECVGIRVTSVSV